MSPIELTSEVRLQLEREAAHLAREFAGVFDPATVREQVFVAAQRLPTPRVEAYRAAFAHRYARDLLRSVARATGKVAAVRPQVLFVCVQNAGRSQMAAAFATALSGGRVDVLSAGSTPAGDVHPAVFEAMREVGIDLAGAFPKPLSDEFVQASDAVVTMGCGDTCPVYPGKRYEDWDVADPAGMPPERVREIRDDVERRVRRLLETLGVRARP
jgi:protein-tyrosine-phosphatase